MRIFLALMILASAAQVAPSSAQVQVPQIGSGSSVFDGWVNMRASSFPGVSTTIFPGSPAWSTPALSNQAGSGDADLNKASGNAFFAPGSLYVGSFTQVPNALGATFRVRDQNPLGGVRTIVFQIQIGEADGYDFHDPAGFPVLKLNGANSSIAPSFQRVLGSYQSGNFNSPATGLEPLYVNTHAFQWNLAPGSVASFAIEFGAVTHAQIYAMRLDQGAAAVAYDVFGAPPPSGPPMLGLVSVGTPVFNGTHTTVVHGFQGDPDSNFNMQYKEGIDSTAWVSAGTYSTGNGTFNATFSTSGDRRDAWGQKMFFRATRQ